MEIYECPNCSSEGYPKCVQFHNCFRLIKSYTVNTDNFLCPWERPLHFLKIRPLNMDTSYADNGQLFLAQSTDSPRKSNSLMGTPHCQLCAVISST